ncbi:hypothetical protein N656DRAFT_776812 [Canariomyces notabilis]|uniref:C2H2-type domain-containing protein n=1 Tax=Canariomyces notabilis TaxID=2074819 RepID=A0AAN6YVL7_9PEZI|nr:hypothetical protein N656DRAFT_776812 [Canariomyces arenarius]
MNDYCKRSECRCGQSTWCRTKSFLKRALSMGSRRKSQPTPGNNQEGTPEWPGEAYAEEDDDIRRAHELELLQHPVELFGNDHRQYELAAQRWTAFYPRRWAAYSCPSASYAPVSTGCHAGVTMSYPAASFQTSEQARPIFELPGQPFHHMQPMTPQYTASPSPRSPTGVSLVSESIVSTRDNHSFVSPQTSVSSGSTDLSTSPTVVDCRVPLFADCTTESPVEYGQGDGSIAPWDSHRVVAQPGSWDSTTTVAELPGSIPPIAPETGLWLPAAELAEVAKATPQLTQGKALPDFVPYPISSPSNPLVGERELRIPCDESASQVTGNMLSQVPDLSISSTSHSIDLENLSSIFSKLRRTPIWGSAGMGWLLEVSDEDALLAGIDELERIRQGQAGGSAHSRLCFAHLVLSMAAERGKILLDSCRTLQQEIENFVNGNGESDPPQSFLTISGEFLYALHSQIGSETGNLWHLTPGLEERRPTILSLIFMRAQFQARSAQHGHDLQQRGVEVRQNSWNSTASTVLDVVLPGEDPGVVPEGTSTPSATHAASDLPSQQRVAARNKTPSRLKRAQRELMGCGPCNFFPAKGPDQRKKLEKHKKTDKHRRKTNQLGAGERFRCPSCPKSYNRRDNMREHHKTHLLLLELSLAEGQDGRMS